MAKVKSGDTVQVHYKGTLKSGELFDSSEGREPLEFTVGSGQVINGFDTAVVDMEPGETKTVNIPVDQAYGERSQDALISVPRSEFPADITPEIGQELQMSDDQGHIFPVIVAGVEADTVVLDANHPLAGQELTFEINLVKIA
jgi:FKBP-type peptidyl-prolyl cis-trans isomerase 2